MSNYNAFLPHTPADKFGSRYLGPNRWLSPIVAPSAEDSVSTDTLINLRAQP